MSPPSLPLLLRTILGLLAGAGLGLVWWKVGRKAAQAALTDRPEWRWPLRKGC